MSDRISKRVTPQTAEMLATWAGMSETMSPDHLAEIFENVAQLVERLYAVDVDGFEAAFLQPDNRAG